MPRCSVIVSADTACFTRLARYTGALEQMNRSKLRFAGLCMPLRLGGDILKQSNHDRLQRTDNDTGQALLQCVTRRSHAELTRPIASGPASATSRIGSEHWYSLLLMFSY